MLYGYELLILEGALLTIIVAILSMIISLVLGLLLALAKLSKSKAFSIPVTIYTTIIRGVPDLVLMLLIFYGGQALLNSLLEALNYEGYISINPFIAGVMTISLIFSAYLTETFRGAILAIPKGEIEAGVAFGLSPPRLVCKIMLFQILRNALAGISNVWLVLLKATAIISLIGLEDMVRRASLAAGATQKPFNFHLAVAFIYLFFTFISTKILKSAEIKLNACYKK